MRSLGYAHRPAGSQVFVTGFRFEIVIENLVSIVGPVGYPNVALTIDLQAVRQIEFTGSLAGSLITGLGEKSSVLIELDDAIVAVSIQNEDVPLRVPTHI